MVNDNQNMKRKLYTLGNTLYIPTCDLELGTYLYSTQLNCVTLKISFIVLVKSESPMTYHKDF